MYEDTKTRTGYWLMSIIAGLITLVLLILLILGDHFYTVHPAVRAVSNGVPVCSNVRRIAGGEPSAISRLGPDEQKQFFSAIKRKHPTFALSEYMETSIVLLYQRKGGVAPLFVVLVPLNKEAAPQEMKFCALFEQTPWDLETQHIAEKAGEPWRMRTMTPEQKQSGI